ncbi:MAG: bacterial Ig-like domain-containing protein [Firmicutes bacterium]|uniref:Bacterial Ig-like domain-containing protein n=1 Tax=Candidatus Alloenteromonas pullistercoris TaxID=2840785 RepID=A0A9D9DGY8_9FIRM|nr:bacterial Ig-like domain-containing protein [Candidatus Enteromonas pullistercoris]
MKGKGLLLSSLGTLLSLGLVLAAKGAYSATGDVTEVDAAAPNGYTMLTQTNMDAIDVGSQLILGVDKDPFEALNTIESKWGRIGTDNWIVFTVESVNPDSSSLVASYDGGSYLATGGDFNVSSSPVTLYIRDGAFSATGDPNGQICASTASDSRSLRYNSSSDGLRWYASNSGLRDFAHFYIVPSADVTSIEVTTAPTKTEYMVGETFDPTGMVVTATFDDGSSQVVTDYTLNPDTPTPLTADVESIEISYTYDEKTVTTTQPITVTERTVQSIEITTNPTKTSYVVGQEFDPTGMVVTAVYDNGDPADVTSECTFSPSFFEQAGEAVTVTVTHTPSQKTATLTVEVLEKAVSSLSLTGKRDAFDNGDTFTLGDGAELTAIWNDGTETPLTLDSEGVTVELTTKEGKPGEGRAIDSSYVLNYETDNQAYVLITYEGESAKKYQITVRDVLDVSEGKFVLVENVSELAVGDYIIIAAEYEGTTYALSTDDAGNYRGITEVNADGNAISLVKGGDAQVIELVEGVNAGTFGFSVAGGYLTAGVTGNDLTTEETLNDESSWVISKENDAFSVKADVDDAISNPRNIMKFNWNNGTNSRFSCYRASSEGMTDVDVYKYYSNDYIAVSEFVDANMHMDDYSGEGTGLCLGEDGYYAVAKAALTKLTEAQIELFQTESDFSAAHERYLAWASANGDQNPYDMGSAAAALRSNNGTDDKTVIAISVIGIAGIASAAAFFFLRRRKEA